MSTEKETRLLILPITNYNNNNDVIVFFKTVIAGIETKLSTINTLSITNLNDKKFETLNISGDIIDKKSELALINKKFDAKYAIKLTIKEITPNTAIKIILIDLSIPEQLFYAECSYNWDFNNTNSDFADKTRILNELITDITNKTLTSIGFRLENNLKDYINSAIFTNPDVFLKLYETINCKESLNARINEINRLKGLDQSIEFAALEESKLLRQARYFEKAISILSEDLKLKRSNYITSIIYNDIGKYYTALKMNQQAKEAWDKAIKHNMYFIAPYISIADLMEEEENNDEAEKYYIEVQKIAPEDFRTYFNLARIYSKKSEWQKSIEEYIKHLKFNPTDPWSHSNIANCYLQMGKNREAQSYLTRTTELNPDGEAGIYAKQVLEALEEERKKDWWKFWKKY